MLLSFVILLLSFENKRLYIPKPPTLFVFLPRQHQTEAVTKTASCDQRAKASSCTTTRCRTERQRTRRAAGTRTPNQRRQTRIGSSRTERTIAPAPMLPVSSPAFSSVVLIILTLFWCFLTSLTALLQILITSTDFCVFFFCLLKRDG